MKNYITSILFLFVLQACSIFGPKKIRGTTYNEKLDNNQTLKIIYSNNPYNKFYVLNLEKKNKLEYQIIFNGLPTKFVIDKTVFSEKGGRSFYRMVSDTTNNNLVCIDFKFLQNVKDTNVISSFIPLNLKEMQMLEKFSKFLLEKGVETNLSKADIERFKGWVLINY